MARDLWPYPLPLTCCDKDDPSRRGTQKVFLDKFLFQLQTTVLAPVLLGSGWPSLEVLILPVQGPQWKNTALGQESKFNSCLPFVFIQPIDYEGFLHS